MLYLAAAVAIVGLLCLLDLILTVGVIRRLRLHTEHLDRLLAGGGPPEVIPAGQLVGDFAATTTGGEPVARDLLAGRTLVGFFSPGCPPCEELLPRFVEHARSVPERTRQVLAVVAAGDEDGAASYARRLEPVARVVVEGSQGALQAAFRVGGFPTVYLLEGAGTVVAGGTGLDEVVRTDEVVRGG